MEQSKQAAIQAAAREAVEKNRSVFEIEQINRIKAESKNTVAIFCGFSPETLKEAAENLKNDIKQLKANLREWRRKTYSQWIIELYGEDTQEARNLTTEADFTIARKEILHDLPLVLKLYAQRLSLYETAQYYQRVNGRRDGNNLYNVNAPNNLEIYTNRELLIYYLAH